MVEQSAVPRRPAALGLWGIWCVELHAWCRACDSAPETYASKTMAQLRAIDWREQNAWQSAHMVWDRYAGRAVLAWTYEVRPYVSVGAR